MIDRDALVNRLQFTIDDGTLRERDGGCRTATDHEIALWNILTAPAEAPVATVRRPAYALLGSEPAVTWHSFPLEGTKLYAAPLPQSAPVSREAVEWLDERDVKTAYEMMRNGNFPDHAACRVIESCHRAVQIAAHPAEPAGKGE